MDEQQTTNNGTIELYVIVVYVSAHQQKKETSRIYNLNNNEPLVDRPWCIRGDLNVIHYSREKLGGRSHKASKSFNFVEYMNNYGVTDAGYVGSTFTWCNN